MKLVTVQEARAHREEYVCICHECKELKQAVIAFGEYVNICQECLEGAMLAFKKPHNNPNLRIFMDGNMWCALLGDNLQEGVAGFGETIEQALVEFDKNARATGS